MRTLLVIFLLSVKSWAAPFPVTSSSIFLDRKLNLFLLPFKIEVNFQKTPFEMDLSQNDSEKWTIKSSETGMQISLRIRQLGPKEDYDKSLRNWIREYEKSGFQIIGQQIPKKNAERGWIHLQDSQEKQLVQYFRLKDRTWVYFNCVGKKENITQLKQSCDYLNSILTFRPTNIQ